MNRKSEVSSRKLDVKQILLSFSLLISTVQLSLAAEPPVLVEPAAASPNVRLGKPMPTLWDVTKRQPGLLEGKLEFRVHLGAEEFFTYTTDELVLHASDQRLRFLFPAVTSSVQTPELEVDVTWVGKSGRVPLRMQIIRVPFTSQKTMLMAVGEERTGHSRAPEWEARLESVLVESLASPQVKEMLRGRESFLPLQTVIHVWEAGLFPQEPLGYTPYDAVAIKGDVFRALRKQQLESLEIWVRAGGRLYIEPTGLHEPAHADFLNRLTAHESTPVRWTLDRVGNLDWPVLLEADEYRTVVDLGRVVIRNPQATITTLSEQSQRFLWDVPPGVDPVQQQLYGPRLPASSRQVLPNGAVIMTNIYSSYGQLPQSLYTDVEAALMPSGVQVVPIWMIAALLGGLVIAIGPGEWWLLGKLRLRRFTWLTWPIATIAVTAATVGLSNWFMGAAENSRFLELVDLGGNGRVVRTQRFDLTFPSRARAVSVDMQRGLWRVVEPPQQDPNTPPVFLTTMINGRMATMPAPTMANRTTTRLAAPRFDGRVPNRYTATQTVPQWTPRVSHRYELPTADAERPIDWSGLDPLLPDDFTQPPVLQSQLASQVTKQFGHEAFVVLMDPLGGAKPYFATELQPIGILMQLLAKLTVQDANFGTDPWTASTGRFAWAELPILSRIGPYSGAVMIVVPNGSGWTVYRRPVRLADLTQQ